MNVAAELQGVSKFYGSGEGRITALHKVNLRLEAGQVTLIEGPSGGGKTTLLQILGLLLPPDEGRVVIAGEDWTDRSQAELTEARRQHIAFVFQDFNLMESLSAHDNVAVVASLHGSGADASARDLLAQVELTGRDQHLPSQMSGGQKQRVSIARALASRGDLVLADEPTANLDWTVGEPVIALLAEMAHAEGRCVVIVSHDARLEPYADRVVRLSDGMIENDRPKRRTALPPAAPIPPQAAERPWPLSPRGAAIPAPPLNANADWEPSDADELQTPGTVPAPVSAAAVAAAPRRRAVPRRRALRVWLTILVLLGVLGLVVRLFLGEGGFPGRSSAGPLPTQPAGGASPAAWDVLAAAPAAVEPASRVVQIASDRVGTIKRITVKAGDSVEVGQILVQLDDEEAESLVGLRAAELKSAEAAVADLVAWMRPERREEAAAAVDASKAKLDKAQFEHEKATKLFAENATGTAEVRAAEEALKLAQADGRRAEALLKLANAGPTPTELQRTETRVSEAKAQLLAAKVSLERRTLRSPIRGKVLYVYLEPGEMVNPQINTPMMSLAAAGSLRLRAEVDEIDIGRIHVGQAVLVTADSFPNRQFFGRVHHLENIMGRRNIKTGRATERAYMKVLEVVIELDDSARDLPIDLVVTARFLARDAAATQP